jgi:hypothetical protein
LVKLIEDVNAWDRARPETLRGIDRGVAKGLSKHEFQIVQRNFVRQAKQRLSYLRAREMMRSGAIPIAPLTVEGKLARLLSFVRPKAKYPRNATYIAHHFNAQERRILYELLDDIEEHVPWKGFDLIEAWKQIRRARGERP